MKDIILAKDILENEGLTLAIVKDGKVLFKSKEKGIKPLFIAVNELSRKLNGASVADRVIGRAAALLCKEYGIKEIYTKLISESAIDVLKEGKIEYKFEESSPYIKNRNKTDMCPVEKLSQDIKNTPLLLDKIRSFLESINKSIR